MIKGLRIFLRDKVLFRNEGGIFRQVGNPMDALRTFPDDVKILHIVDLNAKDGNTTNFDMYNHMTYNRNIQVEIGAREELVKKLIALKARAVLELPCPLDLGRFSESKRLLVGRITGDERSEDVFDYYLESEKMELVKKIVKGGKRVFLYSKTISEKDAEKAGVFALVKDF